MLMLNCQSLIEKLTQIKKTKYLVVENELKKVKTFDPSYFIGKSHFEEVGTQHYLVFQPMYRYFKRLRSVGSGSYIFTFIFANLKHPLVKILQLLVQVISNSIQNYVFWY